jgi:CelD/BcsL family acetyltransferase involved in cellulose biosynthesis
MGMARALGFGLSDCQGLVVPAGAEPDGQRLLRSCGVLLWRFDHLLAHQAAALGGDAVVVDSPLIDLEDGFEPYLAGRRAGSKSLLATAERKARKLGREVGPLHFEPQARDHGLLDRLIEWKRQQYARTGVPDVLADPAVGAVLHDLLDHDGSEMRAPLSVLYAGDHPVALHLGLRSADELAWWLPTYDPAYATYSPGVTFMLRLAQWAAGVGVRRIDLGKGTEAYKERLRNGARPIADGQLVRHGGRGAAAAARSVRRRLRSARSRVPALAGGEVGS